MHWYTPHSTFLSSDNATVWSLVSCCIKWTNTTIYEIFFRNHSSRLSHSYFARLYLIEKSLSHIYSENTQQEQKAVCRYYIVLGEWGCCWICSLKFERGWSHFFFKFFHKCLSQWECNKVIYYTSCSSEMYTLSILKWTVNLLLRKLNHLQLAKENKSVPTQIHWNCFLLLYPMYPS